MPTLVIVAGPNGSGKTTLVRSGILSRLIGVPPGSLNADDLARELAGGGQPSDAQSLEAARTSDARLDAAIEAGQSVTVETVLSSDKFKRRLDAAHARGFVVVLVYVTVRSPALSIARVAHRVDQGGHAVPEDRIRARRDRSHRMFEWFARAADLVFVFDNSGAVPLAVASKDAGGWTADPRRLALLPSDLAMIVRRLAG